MDSPTPKLGDPARLMLTDLASGIGSIHTGTVVDVGPTWVRVRVGNGNLVLRWDQLPEHERRCAAAELADARAKRGGK